MIQACHGGQEEAVLPPRERGRHRRSLGLEQVKALVHAAPSPPARNEGPSDEGGESWTCTAFG